MSSITHADFDRALPLEGAFNLRDMGGYETRSGGRVKRGMLYRSGMMAHLTEADERHMASLGIATVCDLRRPGERRAEPTRWCEPAGVHYWCRDYTEASGVLEQTIKNTMPSAEAMRQAMLQIYREIPTDHAPSYRAMFDRLLGGHVPLLFNCTAGKDRTGVGAALILHVLEVSRETIFEDYLLTNVHADFPTYLAKRKSVIVKFEPETMAPLLAADADYLTEALATLDAEFGGVDAYLANVLGVDDAAKSRLRSMLVE